MREDFNVAVFLMQVSSFILGITIHEWAHAITADKLGDPTPRSQGRVTLWPLAHLDPIGTVLAVLSLYTGFGIGWGKPVMTTPSNYRLNPRIAGSLVAFAGPLSNLVIAFTFAFILRWGVVTDPAFVKWMDVIVWGNTVLFLFNLLPVFPLDGSHLLANALPPPMGEAYRRFMGQFGLFIFLALVLSRGLGLVLGPAVWTLYTFLMG